MEHKVAKYSWKCQKIKYQASQSDLQNKKEYEKHKRRNLGVKQGKRYRRIWLPAKLWREKSSLECILHSGVDVDILIRQSSKYDKYILWQTRI